MTAFQLGPLVLSAPRFYAALALAVLVLVAELVVWRRRRAATLPVPGSPAASAVPAAPATQATPAIQVAPVAPATPVAPSAAWAWNACFAVLIAARVGYVIENFVLFAAQPLSILQFWQGGFSPWWGIGAGLLVAAWAVRSRSTTVNVVALPAVLALGTWLLVPALLSPAQGLDRQLPPIVMETLEGGELDLASLIGQPVVVNLWATWCPPCRRELPMLASAAQTHTDVRFVFADQAETRATVVEYLAEREDLQLSGIVLDARGRLANEFGAVGLPTTLFFDAAGKHVRTHAGELSSVMLVNYLADLSQ